VKVRSNGVSCEPRPHSFPLGPTRRRTKGETARPARRERVPCPARGGKRKDIEAGSRLARLAVLASVWMVGCATYHRAPLESAGVDKRLAPLGLPAVQARINELEHPLLKPLTMDLQNGLSPDEAAVLAAAANPTLVALRDRREIAAAELLQAGILPNPQLSYSLDVPTGGATLDTVNGFGLVFGWDVLSAILTRGARLDAARAGAASVDLDVAWQEWQVAQSAKLQVYRLVFLAKELGVAREEESGLSDNLDLVRRAVDLRDMTLVDLAAARAALRNAHDRVLLIEQRREQERLILNQSLGLPPERRVVLQKNIELPSPSKLPSVPKIMEGIEKRRLDLLAFQMGYESQEASLRAAIRAQFPRIQIGLSDLRDTGNVVTTGFGVTIELPFFNRNQGRIAVERANRKELFDEYTARLFDARSQAAGILADMNSVQLQIDAGEESIEALKELVETYHRALLEGEVDVLSYYNARRELTSKQIEIFQLKRDLADLSIALELAAGMYLSPEDIGEMPK
jgi:cobalt-zinc-cadmium efflux system outer membrane protein